MRNRPAHRLIGVRALHLSGERCYGLAAAWLRLMHSVRTWRIAEGWILKFSRISGALVGAVARKQSVRREAIWAEIFSRFEAAFRHALLVSTCASHEIGSEMTVCVLRLHDLVNADPKNKCLPELMWMACDSSRTIPSVAKGALRARFHLRALLDEMPSSDERGALRFFIFSTDEERAKRKLAGTTIRNEYGSEQKRAVEIGLANFAAYLYERRGKVQALTGGAISASSLTTAQAAFDLIVDSVT